MIIKWTGLAPWKFEFPFPGSLTSTFLVNLCFNPETPKSKALQPLNHKTQVLKALTKL
jgi:hypothetical protein